MTRRLLASILLATLATGCAMPAAPRAQAPAATVLAARASAGFHDLQGKTTSLATFAGKPVVVSFLTPNQPDCEAQLPLLIRLADAYAAEGVAFVVAGEGAGPAALKAFVAAHQLEFPVWEDRQGQEWRSRGFSAVPAHEFRRRDGSVQHGHQGFMSRGELTEQLEALVSGVSGNQAGKSFAN